MRGERHVRLVALAGLALLAGCSKCGKAGPQVEGVERVLPKGAVVVVVVPQVEAVGQKLAIVEKLKVAGFLAQLKGFADARGFSDALVGELGVDVRSKEALEQAGIDGQRAMGAAVLMTGHAYLALPVKDAAKLHTALETLSFRRLGAGAGGAQKAGEVVVKTFSPQAGQPPRLGYVLAHGYALVATEDAIGKLAMLATLPETDALSSDAKLKEAQARLGGERDLFAWLPPGSPVLGGVPVSSALVTASLTPQGLTVAVDAPWKGDPQQLAVLEARPGPELLGVLPRDAFLVARFNGDPQRLAPFTGELLGPYLSRAFAEAQFDVKSEVLEKLKPGAVVALSLAERPPMDRGLPSFDIRQTNPFTYAHLSGAAPLSSADQAWPTLEKVAQVSPRFGAQMQKAEREGTPVLLTSYAQGEGVHFAVKGDTVLFASPVQRLDALVKRQAEGGSPVAGLGTDALAVAVDLTRLNQSVRALPESAWGIGGFAIKATTVRWLDAMDDLKAVTVAVGAKDRVVQAKAVLKLGGAEAAKAP
ncbi:MAG: hypothetical protein IT380_10825 [Myxococcales bacterium]|nr:hypothetical protein [Myxococcales bacterium]